MQRPARPASKMSAPTARSGRPVGGGVAERRADWKETLSSSVCRAAQDHAAGPRSCRGESPLPAGKAPRGASFRGVLRADKRHRAAPVWPSGEWRQTRSHRSRDFCFFPPPGTQTLPSCWWCRTCRCTRPSSRPRTLPGKADTAPTGMPWRRWTGASVRLSVCLSVCVFRVHLRRGADL